MARNHSAGFTSCGPFADYQPSHDNMFMTLELDTVQTRRDADA